LSTLGRSVERPYKVFVAAGRELPSSRFGGSSPRRATWSGRRMGRCRCCVAASWGLGLIAPPSLPRRGGVRGRRIPKVVARSTLRAITFAPNSAALRLSLTSIAPTHAAIASVAVVVARSSLSEGRRAVVATGDYVRAKLRCAPFDTHIHRPYSRRYRVDVAGVVARSSHSPFGR
jgi:hypothetical protein